jgi:hypothetical protein
MVKLEVREVNHEAGKQTQWTDKYSAFVLVGGHGVGEDKSIATDQAKKTDR